MQVELFRELPAELRRRVALLAIRLSRERLCATLVAAAERAAAVADEPIAPDGEVPSDEVLVVAPADRRLRAGALAVWRHGAEFRNGGETRPVHRAAVLTPPGTLRGGTTADGTVYKRADELSRGREWTLRSAVARNARFLAAKGGRARKVHVAHATRDGRRWRFRAATLRVPGGASADELSRAVAAFAPSFDS